MQILTMFRGFMSKKKEIKLNKSNKKKEAGKHYCTFYDYSLHDAKVARAAGLTDRAAHFNAIKHNRIK